MPRARPAVRRAAVRWRSQPGLRSVLKDLADSHKVSERLLAEPFPARDESGTEIAEMGDRSAERCQAEPQEGQKNGKGRPLGPALVFRSGGVRLHVCPAWRRRLGVLLVRRLVLAEVGEQLLGRDVLALGLLAIGRSFGRSGGRRRPCAASGRRGGRPSRHARRRAWRPLSKRWRRVRSGCTDPASPGRPA